jgi:hypothetical protein
MKQNKHSKTKNVKQNDEKKRKNSFSHFQTKNAKQNYLKETYLEVKQKNFSGSFSFGAKKCLFLL